MKEENKEKGEERIKRVDEDNRRRKGQGMGTGRRY